MIVAPTNRPTFLAPERLYSIRGFCRASGLSYSRLREAARAGVEIPTFRVGKRKFIFGGDAIDLVRQLAEQTRREMSALAEGGNAN
jgi:hypothetical protein